jgi:hypothetical protein
MLGRKLTVIVPDRMSSSVERLDSRVGSVLG